MAISRDSIVDAVCLVLDKPPAGKGDERHMSRNAILHGADIEYPTKENAVRALVWLDTLVVCELERASSAARTTSSRAASSASRVASRDTLE